MRSKGATTIAEGRVPKSPIRKGGFLSRDKVPHFKGFHSGDKTRSHPIDKTGMSEETLNTLDEAFSNCFWVHKAIKPKERIMRLKWIKREFKGWENTKMGNLASGVQWMKLSVRPRLSIHQSISSCLYTCLIYPSSNFIHKLTRNLYTHPIHTMLDIPVLVEATTTILTQVLSPDKFEGSETMRSLNVPNNSDDNNRWGFNDCHGLYNFLLVHL